MTQQEMHIAVCEWMGWKFHCVNSLQEHVYHGPHGEVASLEDSQQGLPPLTLDWLHECESQIKETRRGQYNAELSLIAAKRPLSSAVKEPQFIFDCIHATPQQRLEALCRTLFPERFK